MQQVYKYDSITSKPNPKGKHSRLEHDRRRQEGITEMMFSPDGESGNTLDRLAALGRSIVPQIAELLFRQIKELL